MENNSNLGMWRDLFSEIFLNLKLASHKIGPLVSLSLLLLFHWFRSFYFGKKWPNLVQLNVLSKQNSTGKVSFYTRIVPVIILNRMVFLQRGKNEKQKTIDFNRCTLTMTILQSELSADPKLFPRMCYNVQGEPSNLSWGSLAEELSKYNWFNTLQNNRLGCLWKCWTHKFKMWDRRC